MRVGIDGRSLAGPQDRGVTHVTRSLVAALAAGFPDDRLDVLVPGGGPWAPPAALDRANVRIVRHPVPSRLLFGAAALAGRPRLDRLLGGVDVLWIPAPAPLAASRRVPLVLTRARSLLGAAPAGLHARTSGCGTRWPARGAWPSARARVAAVSRATAVEVQRRWGISPARVTVVPNGIDLPPLEPGAARARPARALPALRRRARAAQGARAPGRGLRGGRARRGSSADLVLVGAGRLAPRLHAPGVRQLGGGPARRAAGPVRRCAGARHALAGSRASDCPPLEALARGTPAVVSDLPVFAETLGDGRPARGARRPDALAGALLRVAGDAGLRARLAAAGAAGGGLADVGARGAGAARRARGGRGGLAEMTRPSAR